MAIFWPTWKKILCYETEMEGRNIIIKLFWLVCIIIKFWYLIWVMSHPKVRQASCLECPINRWSLFHIWSAGREDIRPSPENCHAPYPMCPDRPTYRIIGVSPLSRHLGFGAPTSLACSPWPENGCGWSNSSGRDHLVSFRSAPSITLTLSVWVDSSLCLVRFGN